jgi:metal-responsive CopG/Arc/MetJ family transcriptional regulator
MAAMVKVTFTLDDDTVATIRTIAERKRKPQSQIVRDAVAAYGQQEDKLGADERARRLSVLDDLSARPRTRPPAAVDRELAEIRRSRRAGWRRRPE